LTRKNRAELQRQADQEEITLLNQNLMGESSKQITDRLLGEKSRPILFFRWITEEQTAGVYISNQDGQDPAIDVTGTFTYSANTKSQTNPPLAIGPITVPAHDNSPVIRVDMGPCSEVVIHANFTTISGSEYAEVLYVASVYRIWPSAYELTDLRNNTKQYYVATEFPIDRFPDADRDHIRSWAKKQESNDGSQGDGQVNV